ncbi:MAG: oligosaccharide repeat unit polymerase [Phycisphaeraceae bacterium]|nr:oligosaccharide repeat unit polymerase [Phycisphaeraceae bacterium]
MAQLIVRLAIHPLAVFLAVWLCVIGLYSWHILEYFEPGRTAWGVLGLSVLSYLAGMVLAGLWLPPRPFKPMADDAPAGALDWRRLGFFWVVAGLVIVRNWWLAGPPPLLTLGLAAPTYLEYGSFNAVWPTVCVATVALSARAPRAWQRWAMRVIPMAMFVLHITRGWLIMAVLFWVLTEVQARRVNDLRDVRLGRRSSMARTRRAVWLLGTAAVGVTGVMWAMGEIRTGGKTMMDALQVSPHVRPAGTGLIWVMSYISGSFDNVVYWMDQGSSADRGSVSLAYLLPGALQESWAGYNVSRAAELARQPLNNAPHYLGPAVLDFRWAGVIGVNLIYGALGQWSAARMTRGGGRMFTHTVVLGATYLSFFAPYLLFFPYLLMWAIGVVCFRSARTARRTGGAPAATDVQATSTTG